MAMRLEVLQQPPLNGTARILFAFNALANVSGGRGGCSQDRSNQSAILAVKNQMGMAMTVGYVVRDY